MKKLLFLLLLPILSFAQSPTPVSYLRLKELPDLTSGSFSAPLPYSSIGAYQGVIYYLINGQPVRRLSATFDFPSLSGHGANEVLIYDGVGGTSFSPLKTIYGSSILGTGNFIFNSDQITEGPTNLYFTQARARGSLSFTPGSGAYNSTTGLFTIPTNTSQLTNGAGFVTPSSVATFTNKSGNISQWSNDVGYLITETDPIFITHTTHNIVNGTGFLKNNGTGTWSYDNNTYLTGNQTITLSGAVSGSGTTSISTTLSNTGVSAGSYTNSNLTVGVDGRIITITNGTTLVQSVASADNSINVTNPTTTVDLSVLKSPKWSTARNLAGNSVDGSVNVAFLNKFIVQGTTDSGLSGAQFLGALGTGLVKNTTSTGVLSIAISGTDYQAPGSYITALTGDITASGPGSVAAILATVNSNVGTFGNATQVPQIVFNAKGLATSITNITITPAVGSITGLGSGIATWLATPSWINFNSAITGTAPFWLTTGSTVLTGASTINSTTPNGLNYSYTWTATANNQDAVEHTGVVTSRNTNNDILNGILIDYTMQRNAGNPTGQTANMVLINGNFSNSFATTNLLKLQTSGINKFVWASDGSGTYAGRQTFSTYINLASTSNSTTVGDIWGAGTEFRGFLSAAGQIIFMGAEATAGANNIPYVGSSGLFYRQSSTFQYNGATFTLTGRAANLAPGTITANFVGGSYGVAGGSLANPASTELSDIVFDNSAPEQWSTGALTLNRTVRFLPRTIRFVGSSTATDVINVSMDGAPVAGTNAALTNTHNLYLVGNAVGAGAVNAFGLTANAPTGATNNYPAQFLGGKVLFSQSTTKAPINLGGFTSDPSTHTEGDLAYNTTSHLLKFWDGTSWVNSSGGVTSVFSRTGAVTATSGDYNTSQVTEVTNLYYTDVRARASNSFTTGSGAYNSTTGVITIPTNTNELTNGAGFITASSSNTLTNKSGNISQWTNDSGYATGSSSTAFTNKSGNISQWTNDSGYITSAGLPQTWVDHNQANADLTTTISQDGINTIVFDNSAAVLNINTTSGTWDVFESFNFSTNDQQDVSGTFTSFLVGPWDYASIIIMSQTTHIAYKIEITGTDNLGAGNNTREKFMKVYKLY